MKSTTIETNRSKYVFSTKLKMNTVNLNELNNNNAKKDRST